MTTRISVGDIVALPTSKGVAYALYTHKHLQFGALLRVFDELFDEPLVDFTELSSVDIAITTFFPLQAAVKKGIIEIVGKMKIPRKLSEFPVFRVEGLPGYSYDKNTPWWLWDGENEWCVGELTAEIRQLPIRGIWNDTMLIERIESGWRAHRVPKLEQR